MRVFELHFNPKSKEDTVFDSFIYEPESIYEKRLGNLYMIGELTKTLPQNTNFLNNLSLIIKKEYYGSPLKKSCEQTFRDALKKANDFLDKETEKGNVSWLGNLSLAALSFKDFILNFTKVGGIKILLKRGEELLDISQNLEFQDIEPYPLKIFGSVASGKLSQDDMIIIFTKDIFSVFTQNKDTINQLSKISDEKGVKEFLKINKKILSEVSGICLLLLVKEELQPKEIFTFRREIQKFSLRKILPFQKIPPNFMEGLMTKLKNKIPEIKFPIPSKKIILVILLILVLVAGFLIFR